MPEVSDVLATGAGHAGCEAALAAARMGCNTLLITISKESIGTMSCNPAIGGLAKGHLVREIDALGGEMGFVTDQVALQYKVLNKAKGPAVWSTRVQCDREGYKKAMARSLESQRNLTLACGNVVDLLVKDRKVYGVITGEGEVFYGKTVVLNSGTFLNGLIHIGDKNFRAGRAGAAPSIGLTDNLVKLGFPAR